MWFIFVIVGFVLLVVCGLYARNRISRALTELGVRARRVRIVRWVVSWLVFVYPVMFVGTMLGSRFLGLPRIRFEGLASSYLLAIPWIVSALVVLQAVPWLLAIDAGHLVARRRLGAPRAARLRALAGLIVIGAFALYTPIRIFVERGEVRMRHYEVTRGSAPPLRIAFLADIQQDVHTDADRAREVYARVNAERPDLVLSGGDWINTGPDYIASAGEAAGTLRSRLGTFSVRGDHEHFAYGDRARSVGEGERAMRAHGVDMVNNDVRWFEHQGKRIAVVFINYNYIARTDAPTMASLLARTAGADYTIAVTHQLDDAMADLLKDNVDLVLAAHTHGGQVNPVVGVVHVPLARLETRFIDGRYRLSARTEVIVTAGVGMSVVPIRYAAPGSIEMIDLRL